MRKCIIFLAAVLMTAASEAQLYLGSNGLNVSGSGSSTEVKLGGTLSQHTDIDLNGVYNLNFKSGSSNYLSILSSGNVGVGTNAPAAKLHVQSSGGLGSGLLIEATSPGSYATADIKNSAGDLSQVGLLGPSYAFGIFNSGSATWNSSGAGGMNIVSYNPDGFIKFGTGGTDASNERMRITADGKVGVGTNAPAAKLHVQSAGGLGNCLLVEATSPGSFATTDIKNSAGDLTQVGMLGPSYTYGIFNSSSATWNSNGSGGMNIVSYHPSGFIKFGTGGDNPSYERMRITADGKVGIGTSNPSAQLHTTGAVRFAGLGNDNTQGRIVVSDANGNLSYRDVSTISGSGAAGWAFNGSTVGVEKKLGTTDNFDLPIITNNVERMRISATGSIGIGTTCPQGLLGVNGDIYAKKIKVTQTGWCDYVFDSTYALPRLEQVERFIRQNKRLPEIPSAAEVEKNGIDLGDNQAALLKKIEELTLYLIEDHKKMEAQQQQLLEQQKKIEALEMKMAKKG